MTLRRPPKRPLPETTKRMKAVRQRNTAPEVAMRRILRELGIGYRTCPRDLPGRPDIANKSRRWCIFVHGCFWHGHRSCKLARLPKTNRRWWMKKITDNRRRDRRKEAAMHGLDYRVVVVWQCELSKRGRIERRLAPIIRLSRR